MDAFAGSGGLSLGLLRAGWDGLFSVERDPFAFDTYRANLLEGRYARHFQWPHWLPCEPLGIDDLLERHTDSLRSHRGSVGLLAGGPPCQGFSDAGRRDLNDPRNDLVRAYLSLVDLIEPCIVLLENVRGITFDFKGSAASNQPSNYAHHLRSALTAQYDVYSTIANAADFGVPQTRRRFILIAFRRGCGLDIEGLEEQIQRTRMAFLRRHRLVLPISASCAISDLELQRNGTIPSDETEGFRAIDYHGPRTHFQHLMREGSCGQPTDTRLANHRADIRQRFADLITRCNKEGRLNISLGREIREEYGLRKLALRVLDAERPAPTITSMPDDLLHYSEPRTLTVRENARLQGFPDWFSFHGNFTTGGPRRRHQIPRFTQVANAVSPLMSEVLGEALLQLWQTQRADARWPSPHRHVHKNSNVSEVDPVIYQVTA